MTEERDLGPNTSRDAYGPLDAPDAPSDAREFVKWYRTEWKGSDRERRHLESTGIPLDYFHEMQDRLNGHGERCRTRLGRIESGVLREIGNIVRGWRQDAGFTNREQRYEISESISPGRYLLLFLESGLVFRDEVSPEFYRQVGEAYSASEEEVQEVISLLNRLPSPDVVPEEAKERSFTGTKEQRQQAQRFIDERFFPLLYFNPRLTTGALSDVFEDYRQEISGEPGADLGWHEVWDRLTHLREIDPEGENRDLIQRAHRLALEVELDRLSGLSPQTA